MKTTLQTTMNKQINHEIMAGYNYLAMSLWADDANFSGLAKFMKHQHEEEMEHAFKLVEHMQDRGVKIALDAVPKPAADYKSPLDVFKAAQKLEKANTAAINELYELAEKEKDYPVKILMQWFIDEQVEEEEWCQRWIDLYEMVGDNPHSLLMLDRQVAAEAEHD